MYIYIYTCYVDINCFFPHQANYLKAPRTGSNHVLAMALLQ